MTTVDFAGWLDADPQLSRVDDRTSLLESLLRRLQTVRGSLWYDPEYGLSLQTFVGTSLTPATVGSLIEREMLKDPRVNNASAIVSIEPDGAVSVVVDIDSVLGPLTVTASSGGPQ